MDQALEPLAYRHRGYMMTSFCNWILLISNVSGCIKQWKRGIHNLSNSKHNGPNGLGKSFILEMEGG